MEGVCSLVPKRRDLWRSSEQLTRDDRVRVLGLSRRIGKHKGRVNCPLIKIIIAKKRSNHDYLCHDNCAFAPTTISKNKWCRTRTYSKNSLHHTSNAFLEWQSQTCRIKLHSSCSEDFMECKVFTEGCLRTYLFILKPQIWLGTLGPSKATSGEIQHVNYRRKQQYQTWRCPIRILVNLDLLSNGTQKITSELKVILTINTSVSKGCHDNKSMDEDVRSWSGDSTFDHTR